MSGNGFSNDYLVDCGCPYCVNEREGRARLSYGDVSAAKVPLAASERQVGGDHYKSLKIQPAAYNHANGIGHLAGDAIAYITRAKFKDGLEAYRKAIHSLELLIELEEKAGA